MPADVWSELTSRGSNIIGESIVLGIPVTTWIPRVKKVRPSAFQCRSIHSFK